MSVRDAYGQIVASGKIARIKRSLEVQEKSRHVFIENVWHCAEKVCNKLIIENNYLTLLIFRNYSWIKEYIRPRGT